MKNKETIRLSNPKAGLKATCIIAGLVAVFALSFHYLNLDLAKFYERLPNAKQVLSNLAVIDLSNISKILAEMFTSLSIALCGLFIGTVLSVVLAFLAARNTAPNKLVGGCIKGAVAVIRAIPALVWILIVVASIGFGNTGGLFGIIIPTTGYLTKSFIASIEEMGEETIEAMQSVGAGWLSITTKGLLPGLLTAFLSWIAIRLEGNVAESISLGMVGIGGVGALLNKALGRYDYGSITAIILVIFLTMLVTEILVNRLKKKISAVQ